MEALGLRPGVQQGRCIALPRTAAHLLPCIHVRPWGWEWGVCVGRLALQGILPWVLTISAREQLTNMQEFKTKKGTGCERAWRGAAES